MEQYKFLVSGPVGAGKTTAIASAANHDVVHTDVKISDTASLRKENTTVAMDYATAVLSNGKKAHLYGTPGQERFDFMWEVLSKGTQGLVLLFDNNRNYPQRDLSSYLSAFSRLINDVPLIIGVTRFDVKNDPPIESYRKWLAEINIDAPVMRVDAREKDDVLMLMENLAKLVEGEELDDSSNIDSIDEPVVTTVDEPFVEDEKIAEASTVEADVVMDEDSQIDFQFTDELMEEVSQLKGVTGIMLNDVTGTLLHSTTDDEQISEFSAMLAGMTLEIENTLSRGKIDQVMLKSRQDDNLTVFIESEQSLGVASERKSSLPVLTQQVKDLLQWS